MLEEVRLVREPRRDLAAAELELALAVRDVEDLGRVLRSDLAGRSEDSTSGTGGDEVRSVTASERERGTHAGILRPALSVAVAV